MDERKEGKEGKTMFKSKFLSGVVGSSPRKLSFKRDTIRMFFAWRSFANLLPQL